MRRYQKKQIEEKIDILHEAHDCVEKFMLNEQDITDLLTDCQELAIEIGTEIENIEGEGTQTVELLEDYCELLYRISERRFPVSTSHMASSTREELENQIHLAEESLQKDIEEQTVIVFFPYKASMWDSMETVWKKYQQDKNAQTLVVPLPYHIKDQSGKKVRNCYEGTDFPSNVPIINYEDFLKNRYYADIAIYHNPYDDSNKVTEVDSRFFTSEMHKYAHTLVYIPYYVLMDKPAISFALAPGVKNADYVILQDEEITQEFQKWHPKEKDKFLPLGSPKIDKAIEMNQVPREELDIPQEWKDRIRGKKVLFYNTHLVNFLDENRDFIGKLKEVFATMQVQDQVVLWWRPHPLSDDMEFTTSQTERFQEYEELVEWYKQENIGIYDDTPKLHEAIAACDAYYGDPSSVVKLFQAVDKPVMLQTRKQKEYVIYGNLKAQEYDGKVVERSGINYNRMTMCVCVINRTMWYISYYNELCAINLETHEMRSVGTLPGVKITDYYAALKIVNIDNDLVIVPYNSRSIITYSIVEKQFRVCELDVEGYCEFLAVEVFQNDIYLVSAMRKKIYCFNVKNNECKMIAEFASIPDISKTSGLVLGSGVRKDKMYFLVYNSDLVLEYDFIRNQLCILEKLRTEEMEYTSMMLLEDRILLFSMKELCVICEDFSTGQIWKRNFPDIGIGESTTGTSYLQDETVYYIPDLTKQALQVDLKQKEVQMVSLKHLFGKEVSGCNVAAADKLYMLPEISYKIIVCEDGTEISVNDDEIVTKRIKEAIWDREQLVENGDFDLEHYLNVI